MGRRFLVERRRDPYYRAAQRDGLRSRAAFKLAHLNEIYAILEPGDRVLDLGAAPGGWSVIALEAVGPRGSVTAVDERSLEPLEGVERLRGRVGSPELERRLGGRQFEVVLSDMSPRISGAYSTDHARSVELVEAAFELARICLRPGGRFVAKVFDGDLVKGLDGRLAPYFEELRRTKPPASRERSSELYLLGFGFRPGGSPG
ncbi:MAG: RlmE family RNA methyltransferase [Thermoplasmata archaeon]|nr:RlmE family RNA methyltransferase [Thermoplasmata archaeon]